MRIGRIALAVVVVITGCVTFAWRQGVSPRVTLYELGRAVDDHDYAGFLRYADAQAIADQLDRAMPRTIPRLTGPMARLAPMPMVKIPEGAFAPQFREQTRRYVETGEAAPRIRELLDTLRGKDAETSIAGVAESPDGSRIVTVRHEFARAGLTMDVRLVMEKRGALWKVTGIDNLSEIMAALDGFEIARIRTDNRDRKVILAGALSVTDGHVTAADPRPLFTFSARNHAPYTIERARLRIVVMAGGDAIGYGDFWMTLHLAPGEERAFTAPAEALQRYSRREPFERWSVTFEPLGLSKSNGEVVELQSGPAGIPE